MQEVTETDGRAQYGRRLGVLGHLGEIEETATIARDGEDMNGMPEALSTAPPPPARP